MSFEVTNSALPAASHPAAGQARAASPALTPARLARARAQAPLVLICHAQGIHAARARHRPSLGNSAPSASLNLFSPASAFFAGDTSSLPASDSIAIPAASSSPWTALSNALQSVAAKMQPQSSFVTNPAAGNSSGSNSTGATPKKTSGFMTWWKTPSSIYASLTNGDLALAAGGVVLLAGALISRKRGRR